MWNRDTVTVIPSLRLVVALRGAKLGPFKPGEADGEANRNLRWLISEGGASPEREETSGAPFPPRSESGEGPTRSLPGKPVVAE